MKARHTRLGMLTLSSNTVLGRLVSSLPGVNMHFSRFAVTEIALTPAALGQLAPSGMIVAARLLADAKVDAIAWNGTSGAWLGFEVPEHDIAMVRAVVQDGCDAVAIVCTNLRGAGTAAALEQELDVPVIDSVAVTLWRSLVMIGYDVDGSTSFGRLST